MTSYFFSFSSLFIVLLYGIFKYTKKYEVSIKSFFKEGFKFVYPLLISVLMSCVLIIPTFYAILSGRSETTVNIDMLNLFITNEMINIDMLKVVVYMSIAIYILMFVIFYIINVKLFKKGVNVD